MRYGVSSPVDSEAPGPMDNRVEYTVEDRRELQPSTWQIYVSQESSTSPCYSAEAHLTGCSSLNPVTVTRRIGDLYSYFCSDFGGAASNAKYFVYKHSSLDTTK